MSRASYCTAGLSDRDIEAALDAIAAAGFRHVELLGQAPHIAEPPAGEALRAFWRRLTERGLDVSNVHAPMNREILGAPEEDWRQEAVGILAGYLRFAADVAAPGLVVHSSPNPLVVPDPDDPHLPARVRDAVRRSLDDLAPIAEAAGVRLLLENLPRPAGYPFAAMTELRALVDAYPAALVGLVLDTGHAWVQRKDPAGEIRMAGPRLYGVHLQDVDYDDPKDSHWVPTCGGLNWASILQALQDVNYAGMYTLESQHGRSGETADQVLLASYQVAREWGVA
jgi:sugar phosphate isomerase/epimerase